MTTLKARITEDMKTAMKAGEQMRLHTVRLALSELKRYEADKGAEPDEATSLSILERMVKQRRDSEQQFRAGNRADLADKEAAEIKILLAYMPQQLSEAEVLALIDQGKAERLAEMGATRVVLAMSDAQDLEQAKDELSACAERLGL